MPQTCFCEKRECTNVTLHGKTGKKVNARARVRWHGTLSVSLLSQICAYVISKTKSVTVDIVLHAKAFVQSSELFNTLNVPKDTRVKRHACDVAYACVKTRFPKQPLSNVAKLIFPGASREIHGRQCSSESNGSDFPCVAAKNCINRSNHS